MCGIAGLHGLSDDALLKQISTQLAHRGPDGEGIFKDKNVSLLNRRLAIIDIAGGNQPIYNEDKSVVTVYNGEIYNYRELRTELEEQGHTFSTQSDTEIIVHAYEQWGVECFNRFNGMFAIALYDRKKERLILARDHFGIKPLYYAFVDHSLDPQDGAVLPTTKLIFSSEIKPIFQSGLIPKKPNDRIIYRYLRYRVHDDCEETFFEGIQKLLPGEYMIVEKDGFEIRNFSTIIQQIRTGQPLAFDAAEFLKEFTKVVRMRLISDVPVGTCLSGGLDSSAVVALVQNLKKEHAKEADAVGRTQNTFSAVFPGASNNEEKYIDTLIKKLPSVKSHKIHPKPEEFFEEIEDFIRTQEEPTISTGPYAQFAVMREAAKHVKVVLDGQGADEMMAGYLPYYVVYLRQLLTHGHWIAFMREFIGSFDIVSMLVIQKLMYGLGIKNILSVEHLLNPNFDKKYEQEDFYVVTTHLKQRLVDDIFKNSLPALLRYEDRNSMRFSIEGRVPFLDMNLLLHLFRMSDDAIIHHGWNKYILRQAFKNILPHSIRTRRNKIGFTTPEYDWFMRMKNRIYSIFLSESFANRPYFNQQQVVDAFEKFIKGKVDDTMVFWRILNLELWLRVFFDEKKIETSQKIEDKSPFIPNRGKHIEIKAEEKIYSRFTIRTDLFKKDDTVPTKISKYVLSFMSELGKKRSFSRLADKDWFIVISEKVVAISQGRSYFIWDIKPGISAQILSKFVRKTPYGIGLGSPWTMQLAIQEAGLGRIILASVASVITKPFGLKGIFYYIAGSGVGAIDGPTEYSLYPSNVSAKLPPAHPKKVAREVHEYLEKKLSKTKARAFKGVVIIDANDLGRNILGNSTSYPDKLIAQIFSDNPMGQANEQTPLTIVIENK